MDFLDPKKRLAHRRRLFIGYFLVATAILVVTYILVLITSGYGYDRKTGTIIQNGLVFVDSHPIGSRIYINGQDKGDVAGRFVLEEGKYKIELKRNSYRTWVRELNLDGSSIERLVYPFIFPTKLIEKDIQTFDTQPDLITASPDRRWILAHRSAAPNNFIVIDTSKKQPVASSITLPATVFGTHTNQTLTAVEWSTDNRHVLLKNTYDGGSDFIMFDREDPAASVNIDDAMGHSFAQIALRDKKYDQLYVYDNGLLETLDIKNKALNIVAQHVASFWPYGSNMVVFATTEGAQAGKALIKIHQDDKSYTLRTVAASDVYMLNVAEFSSHLYVVAGSADEGRAYVYEDPVDFLKQGTPTVPAVKALLKTPGATFATFSANARFIAVQGGSTFAVYDAEANRQYRYDTGLALASGQKAVWMDGHRMNLLSNNKSYVFDFDGANKQELNTVVAGNIALFDQGYTAMYSLSPAVSAAGKTAIVRVGLLPDNQ